MELELKHLLAYFPYGLKALVSDLRFGIVDPFLDKITGIYEDLITFNDSPDWYFDSDENDTEIKLALRPLSDLTKEIEHNGKKFVPIDNFIYKTSVEDFTEFPEQKHNLIHSLKYADIELLLEWNFDIFGLIDKNLAIDINALNK